MASATAVWRRSWNLRPSSRTCALVGFQWAVLKLDGWIGFPARLGKTKAFLAGRRVRGQMLAEQVSHAGGQAHPPAAGLGLGRLPQPLPVDVDDLLDDGHDRLRRNRGWKQERRCRRPRWLCCRPPPCPRNPVARGAVRRPGAGAPASRGVAEPVAQLATVEADRASRRRCCVRRDHAPTSQPSLGVVIGRWPGVTPP